MKLFKIVADRYSYDEYDSIVVACESKEKLQTLIKDGYFSKQAYFDERRQGVIQCINHNDFFYFEEYQKLKIEEVDLGTMDKTTIILCSYNAG